MLLTDSSKGGKQDSTELQEVMGAVLEVLIPTPQLVGTTLVFHHLTSYCIVALHHSKGTAEAWFAI